MMDMHSSVMCLYRIFTIIISKDSRNNLCNMRTETYKDIFKLVTRTLLCDANNVIGRDISHLKPVRLCVICMGLCLETCNVHTVYVCVLFSSFHKISNDEVIVTVCAINHLKPVR